VREKAYRRRRPARQRSASLVGNIRASVMPQKRRGHRGPPKGAKMPRTRARRTVVSGFSAPFT
jgi:hypothetical protein